jgi:hypothetical protein
MALVVERAVEGLGLAVVRSIVTRHDGQIRVDDSPFGGAAEFPAGAMTSTTGHRHDAVRYRSRLGAAAGRGDLQQRTRQRQAAEAVAVL